MRDVVINLLSSRRARRITVLTLVLIVGWMLIPFFKILYLYYINSSPIYAMEVLQSEDEGAQVRNAAAHSLGMMHPRRTAKANYVLVEALKDESPLVASSAAWSLGHSEQYSPKIIDALIEALDHEDKEVRRYTASALRSIGLHHGGHLPRRAIPKLREKLKDPLTRPDVAEALAALGDRPSIPEITAMLSSSSQSDRVCAIVALRDLRPLPEESIRGIEELVDDEDEFVRQLARETIENPHRRSARREDSPLHPW